MKRFLAAVALCAVGAMSQPANAEFIVNFAQDGSNVVVTGSGSLNVTGLPLDFTTPVGNAIAPFEPGFSMGSVTGFSNGVALGSTVNLFSVNVVGPDNFGPGLIAFPSSGTGDQVFFAADDGELGVPVNYVSGAPLSDSLTFDNTTLAALGVTPGSYTYSFDTGDTIVINVPGSITAAVPEPSTWAMLLLGFATVGFIGYRRRNNALSHRLNKACL